MNLLLKYLNTLKYLKSRQIFYLFLRRILRIKKISHNSIRDLSLSVSELNSSNKIKSFLIEGINYSYPENNIKINNKFYKLYKENKFRNELDEYCFYSLPFLRDKIKDLNKKASKTAVIKKIIETTKDISLANDPWPSSKRLINLVTCLVENQIYDNEIISFISHEVKRISKGLEYDLDGNHLLTNFCAIVYSLSYLADKKNCNKYLSLLLHELQEQILPDGSHYELSPIYHSALIIEIGNLYLILKENKEISEINVTSLKSFLDRLIFSYKNLCFESGKPVNFNDSNDESNLCRKQLEEFVKINNLKEDTDNLKQKISNNFIFERRSNYELCIKSSAISSDYIPGHSKSDLASFELAVKGFRIIRNIGTSTYHDLERRDFERSSKASNTIAYNGKSSTEVWDKFRVARRPSEVTWEENSSKNNKEYEIDYNFLGSKQIQHKRKFVCFENKILIEDFIISEEERKLESFLHVEGDVNILDNKTVILSNRNLERDVKVVVNEGKFNIKNSSMAIGFDKLIPSKTISFISRTKKIYIEIELL